MALEQELVTWAQTRPAWQRQVLNKLADGLAIGPAEAEALASALATGEDFDSPDSLSSHLPGTVGPKAETVSLASIQPISNVNALVIGEKLTFGLEGLTVVYGDNGSGKSGYARLAKSVVRSRHHEEVLGDVFQDGSKTPPAARLEVSVDGATQEVDWPASAPSELRRINFYDEACGAAYLTTDSEVAYRPSALFIMDGLIKVCDAVRERIDALLVTNAAGAVKLPLLSPNTSAARFLQQLSGTTSDDEIEAACSAGQDVAASLQQLAEEELRLRAADPEVERARLVGRASELDVLRRHLDALEASLGDDAAQALTAAVREAAQLAAAAAAASATSFPDEPLPGVGTEGWRALWEAARHFSSEVYPEHPFPNTTPGARCVLCQQELEAEGQQRLRRFEDFVADHVQRRADEAAENVERIRQQLDGYSVVRPEVESALRATQTEDAELAAECRRVLAALETRRTQLLATAVEGQYDELPPMPPLPLQTLLSIAGDVRARATAVEASGVAEEIESVRRKREELEATQELARNKDALRIERDRRRERRRLDEARKSTDTTGITKKAADLARTHVSAIITDQFTRECDRLRLDRVTLRDAGGQKGQLKHRPGLLGAVQAVPLPRVLSRGEQTALGLAAFFGEAELDASRSAMILDDPVSSLDHDRRAYVANRLVEFAKTRQVIVFTHDMAFVANLLNASKREEVVRTDRSIERRGDGRPGVCNDTHPWKAKDAAKRLGDLEAVLVRIGRDREQWDQETYERETAEWAGKLSETWERIISLEVAGSVVDRSTLEVRPMMFRVLARITAEDDKEFQSSYGRCSLWARRHDKSLETNYTPPTVEEMTQELALVRAWLARLKQYKT